MAESLGQIDSAARKSLKELSKIQPKEFEKHFREWMERDDVARSLQAKLRRDLISNFNTTHLGKQLLSHTSSAASKAGGINRLTLSPLVLALNTLVAEFLYAQDCHFSLSVFCAEVPYRNTIPDFENTQSFRFTKLEIGHIIEAISGSTKCEDLKKQITQTYRHNKEYSLLYTILSNFVQQYYETLESNTNKGQLMQSNVKKLKHKRDYYDKLPAPPPSLSTLTPISSSIIEATIETDFPTVFSEQFERHELFRERLTNYRLLNKYLMVLSKRVKEMVHQCEHIYQNFNIKDRKSVRTGYRTTRFFKPTPHMNSYESVCQSLDRVTKNLKKLKVTNTSDKHLRTLLDAIHELSRDFGYCATKFENFKDKSSTFKRVEMMTVATETDVTEKPYAEWINEMRYSTNGRKFLDRIAVSLRKALNKQKAQILQEANIKQQHQQELVKLRYRQKYMELLTRNSSKEQNAEARMIGYKIEKQLKQYENRYNELFAKLNEYENKPLEKIKSNPFTQALKATQSPLELPIPPPAAPQPSREDVLTSRLDIQDSALSQDHEKVHELVLNANQRIKELEHEDALVEQNIQDFILSQQQQRETERSLLQRLVQSYAAESQKLNERYEKLNELGNCCQASTSNRNMQHATTVHNTLPPLKEDEYFDIEAFQTQMNSEKPIEFKNAITEAKQAFFVSEQRLKEITSLKDTGSVFADANNMRATTNDDNNMFITFFNKQPFNLDSGCSNPLLANNNNKTNAEELAAATIDTWQKEVFTDMSQTEVTSSQAYLDIPQQSQPEHVTPENVALTATTAKAANPLKEKHMQQHGQRAEQSSEDAPTLHHLHQVNRKPNTPEPILETCTSTTTSTSGSVASNKLQLLQSMAKMQQLFSNAEQELIIKGHAVTTHLPAAEPPINITKLQQQKQQRQQQRQQQQQIQKPHKNLIEIRSDIFEANADVDVDLAAIPRAAGGKQPTEMPAPKTAMNAINSNEKRKHRIMQRHELFEQLQQQLNAERKVEPAHVHTHAHAHAHAHALQMDDYYALGGDSDGCVLNSVNAADPTLLPPASTPECTSPVNTLTVAAAAAILSTSKDYSDSFEFSEDGIFNLPKQHQQLQQQLKELEEQREAVQRAKLQFKNLTANVVAFNASESGSSSGSSQSLSLSSAPTGMQENRKH